MIDREAVIWLYRLLLLREPESDEVIEFHRGMPDIAAFVQAVLGSEEFKIRWRYKIAQVQVGALEHWVWAETEHGFLLRVNLADLYISWAVIRGNFEPNETAFVRKFLQPGWVVFDIGANLGYYTMLAATLIGTKGHVYSFEPLSFLYDSLQRSVATNGFQDRVTTFNVALADRKGEARLLYDPHSENWGGACLVDDVLPGYANERVRIEPVANLVDIGRLDFIKIDVEGAEFIVLSACADMLRRLRPTVLSEIHPGQLERVSGCKPDDYLMLMHTLGYRCHSLTPGGAIGPLLEIGGVKELMSVLFLPDSSSSQQAQPSATGTTGFKMARSIRGLWRRSPGGKGEAARSCRCHQIENSTKCRRALGF